MGPQDFVFQHPLKTQVAVRAIAKNSNNVFSKCYCTCQSAPNSCQNLHNCGHLGFRTPFSSTFLSPWLALKFYKEMPIEFIQRASMLNNFPKFMVVATKWGRQGLRTPFSNTFLCLRSAQRVVHKIWPDQVTHPCSAYVISKNHLSRPCSFRGVGGQNNTFPCVLLYVGCREVSFCCKF